MPFDLLCSSVQGYSHIKKGTPREDYGIIKENDACKVFIVADGHGDSNCPRSQIGSKYICEIAAEELTEFAEKIKSEEWEYKLFDKFESDNLVLQLVTSMFGKWSVKVNEDFLINQLTDEEYEQAKEYAELYKSGKRIEHIYGTTMIAGLFTERYLLLLQQGDGRCVVFNQDGSVSQPIPWDDRCFANVTTSVCDNDAIQSCRYHVIDLNENNIIACFSGSDGIEDSFPSMEKVHSFYRNLLSIACDESVSELQNYLDDYLPKLSSEGSEDDITVCGIVDVIRSKELIEKIMVTNQFEELNDEINRADKKIADMSAKMDYLQSKLEKCKNSRAALEERLVELSDKLTKYKAEYFEAEQKLKGISDGTKAQSLRMKIKDVFDLQVEIGKECDDVQKKLFIAVSNQKPDEVIENDEESSNPPSDENADVLKSIRSWNRSNKTLQVLKEKIDKTEAELHFVEEELEKAKIAEKECESEYVPYKDKYDFYVNLREEALEKFKKLSSE